jgi:hypothetical protein
MNVSVRTPLTLCGGHGMQGWLRKVEAGGAQREMENFEVALDGNIIAREPNGDVIEMSPPGWQVRAESEALFNVLLEVAAKEGLPR